MKLLVVFFLTGFLLGCIADSSYSPPGLSKEDAVYLKVDSERDHGIFQGLDEKLYINAVNGVSIGGFFNGYYESAYIEPGLTEIEVGFYQGKVKSERCVKFLAEKGKSYIVRKKREAWSINFWVELENDINTNVVNLPCGE